MPSEAFFARHYVTKNGGLSLAVFYLHHDCKSPPTPHIWCAMPHPNINHRRQIPAPGTYLLFKCLRWMNGWMDGIFYLNTELYQIKGALSRYLATL